MTAIVLTMNEAANIDRCVRSLGWCSQVLVIDSGSTDGTVEIAQSAGADVLHHPFDGFGAQREWAMRNAAVRHEWVLTVDADEWVSDELAHAVALAIETGIARAYSMRRRFIFQGRWIKYAGWYRSTWLTRLMRKSDAEWHGEVAEKPSINGSTVRIHADLVDEDRKGFEAWLSRHNRYSTLLARRRESIRETPIRDRAASVLRAPVRGTIPRAMAKEVVLPSLPAPGFFLFIYMYFFRGGLLMGRTGFRFCMLHAMQQMHVSMKIDEAALRDECPVPATTATDL